MPLSLSRPPRVIISAILSTLAAVAHVNAAGIERASVELIAPERYRIDFSVSADGWPVAVYPSSRPDAIDKDARPVTARTTTVHVQAQGRRVYFHLRPAAGRTRVVALRHIPLQGASNLRDLGGYRTSDGRSVKWGLVYRSDNLAALTPADYATMNSLGLRLVCDLRTPAERRQAPTQWQGGPAPQLLMTAPGTDTGPARAAAPTAAYARLSNEALRQRLVDIDAGRATHDFDTRYPRLVLDQTAAYKAVFARLLSGELPALTHCTAGQDRTGAFAAVLLLALGVPRDTVMEDYLLTNRYRRPDDYIEEVRRDIQKRLQLAEPPSVEAVRWIEDNHASNLTLGLAAVVSEWGSFDAYLERGLDVSPARVQQLRSRLLED